MIPISRTLTALVAIPALASLTSCAGTPIRGERDAARHVADVGKARDIRPELPGPAERDSLQAYARYALLAHPAVGSRYLAWRAAVADVTVARSLPDPKLTLQLDYNGGLNSLMPGAMFDYMARNKRNAQGKAALAAGEAAYRDYETARLNVVANLRNAWIDLAYADETVRLQSELVAAYEHAASVSANDYETAENGDLSAIVKLRNDAARQTANLESIKARRGAARAAFKAAMGLAHGDADPVWPSVALAASSLPAEEALWAALEVSNPDLLKMRATVVQAVAEVDMAHTAKTPDASFGAMADVKSNPLMVRPQLSMTLPVWKDKIAAQIESANARADEAKADVSATEIALAAEFAQAMYEVRSADATLHYLDETALPALRSQVDISMANFQSGKGMASAPAMAQADALMARLERLDALRMRERAATDLLLLSAGIAPEGDEK